MQKGDGLPSMSVNEFMETGWTRVRFAAGPPKLGASMTAPTPPNNIIPQWLSWCPGRRPEWKLHVNRGHGINAIAQKPRGALYKFNPETGDWDLEVEKIARSCEHCNKGIYAGFFLLDNTYGGRLNHSEASMRLLLSDRIRVFCYTHNSPQGDYRHPNHISDKEAVRML